MKKKPGTDAQIVATPSAGKAATGKKPVQKSATIGKPPAAADASDIKPARKKAASAPADTEPAVRKPARKAAAKSASAVPRAAAASASPVTVPDLPPIRDEEIARLAYSYAEARGFQGGSPDEDWFRARQELLRLRGF